MELLIASTSTIHGGTYLDYILDDVKSFFEGVSEVVFVPYAQPSGISYDDYTAIAAKAFGRIGIKIRGVHTFEDAAKGIDRAEGVFIGGGNTFLLLRELYAQGLVEPLRARVKNGMPYMGTSAGSNVAGQTINNTNDMPIVYPPTFEALGVLPYNMNPHYLDPDPNSTHMGETRQTRINEFHGVSDVPVIGLREGSWLHVSGDGTRLKGIRTARIFKAGQKPTEVEPGVLSI